MMRELSRPTCVFLFFIAAVGCEAAGVGDPCLPEEVPPDGFLGYDAYLSVSPDCRTGTCMVYQLDGVPFGSPGCETAAEVAADPLCSTPEDSSARVYCTCRCDAPPDFDGDLCRCPTGGGPTDPDGYTCVEVDAMGAVCVRNGTFIADV